MTTTVPTMTAAAAIPTALVTRARGEFIEMPGLRLTPRQAARLFGIEGVVSERLLDALVSVGFLCRTADGAYIRRCHP